jgi:transcriptional regulator with XRE-family HTH domain
VQINRYTVAQFMGDEGLRLTDLHLRTKTVDPDGKGVALSFLSELLSGKKTEVSAAVVKKIADALNVRVRAIAANPNDAELVDLARAAS